MVLIHIGKGRTFNLLSQLHRFRTGAARPFRDRSGSSILRSKTRLVLAFSNFRTWSGGINRGPSGATEEMTFGVCSCLANDWAFVLQSALWLACLLIGIFGLAGFGIQNKEGPEPACQGEAEVR